MLTKLNEAKKQNTAGKDKAYADLSDKLNKKTLEINAITKKLSAAQAKIIAFNKIHKSFQEIVEKKIDHLKAFTKEIIQSLIAKQINCASSLGQLKKTYLAIAGIFLK